MGFQPAQSCLSFRIGRVRNFTQWTKSGKCDESYLLTISCQICFKLALSCNCLLPLQFRTQPVFYLKHFRYIVCNSCLLCNNCRPISLLSNIGKIIEKLIHLRLSLFLETHICYYLFQFGFRLNFSTNNALLLKMFKRRLMMANTQLLYLLIWKKPLTLLTITHYLRN